MATVDSNVMDGYSVTKVTFADDSATDNELGDNKSEESPTLEGEGIKGSAPESQQPKRYHRIREVRIQQGVSLRSAARNTGLDVRTLRAQEEPDADLRLSDLWRWQQALDVPMIDLLEEGDAPLSRPVMERARLLRLMKTAAAIHQRCDSPGIRRMAEMLIEQLVEVMPELKDVSAWHNYGQRRSLDEMGRIFENQISDDMSWD